MRRLTHGLATTRAFAAAAVLLLLASAAPVAIAANRAAEQVILSHVPAAIAGSCSSTDPQAGSVAQVACKPGGDVGEADYLLYADNASMDSAFDSHIAVFPEATGQDCSAGASTGNYTINDNPAGRLLCAADNQGTVFFEWTDSRFGIITVGTSASGSYASLYDWWANEAGPVESNGQPIPSAEPSSEPQASSGPTAVPSLGEPTALPEPTPAAATEAPAPTPGASGEPAGGPKSIEEPYSHVTGASI